MSNTCSLIELYRKHTGKVSDKWELYMRVYDEIFQRYRNKPINLLEIGIQNGGSIEIWSNYFHRDSLICGIDIDEKCKELKYDQENIKIIIGDATDSSIIEKIKSLDIEGFDIIIDDGSHVSKDIIKTFVNLFPLLREGGLYIVEDLHCAYWENFGGGLLKEFSSIEFLKLLVDILNHEHWRLNKPRIWLLRDFISEFGISINEMELAKIKSISFYNSLCVIEKDTICENKLGERVVVGNEALVSPDTVPSELNCSSISDLNFGSLPSIYPTRKELLNAITELKSRFTEVEDELVRVRNELDAERQAKVELQTKLTQVEDELVRVYLSKSWRITRPLRWLRRKLKV